jgi:hypothetical protein
MGTRKAAKRGSLRWVSITSVNSFSPTANAVALLESSPPLARIFWTIAKIQQTILIRTYFNGLNIIDVLKTIKTEFPNDSITLIWDFSPYHRSQIVKDLVEPLPG